jgi:sugar phosphate isomerase/epimerase
VRYGIMAIQPEAMMQPCASTRELVANFLRFDHSQLVREVAKHGFSLIELSGDLGMLYPPAFADAAIVKLARVKDKLGLSYTVHLPFHSHGHT